MAASPPCQAARVTFPFGISQSPPAKATASGSLAAVPTAAGMLTSQSSQPSHCLTPAVFTQIRPLPSAAPPRRGKPVRGGGGYSSTFVLIKLDAAKDKEDELNLSYLCNPGPSTPGQPTTGSQEARHPNHAPTLSGIRVIDAPAWTKTLAGHGDQVPAVFPRRSSQCKRAGLKLFGCSSWGQWPASRITSSASGAA